MPVISALNMTQLSELVASIARAPVGTFAAVDRAVLAAAAAKLTGDSSAESPPCKRPCGSNGPLTGAAFVDDVVASSKLVMFSKTTCPFCKKAKSLLSMYLPDLDPSSIVEVNLRDDMSVIQDHLLAKVGKRSVPQLFIGGKHVGGCDDMVAAHENGMLQVMIDATLAKPKEEPVFSMPEGGG